MKELSTEKAYDGNYKVYTELKNRLEDVKDAIKKQNYGIAMDMLCKPYPAFQIITPSSELKESEDEKIRKALIEGFNKLDKSAIWYNGITNGQILSWLEKQDKQQDVSIQINPSEYINDMGGNGCYLKPADKTEPKFKVKYAGSEYNVLEVKDIAGVTYYGIEDESNHIDYVKAENCKIISVYAIKENGSSYPTKPAVFSEQKTAWNEEDCLQLDAAISIVANSGHTCTSDWLKSLKDKCIPQPQQEWSEEDEEIIKNIIAALNKLSENILSYEPLYQKEINWLKSLRPQSTWKPSKEMLEALYKAIPENMMEMSEDEMLLDKLYQGLKYGKVLSEK